MMFRSMLASFVALALAPLGACDPTVSCENDSCEPDAPLPMPDDDAGSCTDAACSDGLGCNGEERCKEGACVAGTPVVCDDGMLCQEEDGQGRCVAEDRGPWLVHASDALDPTDGLEHQGTYHLMGTPSDVAGSMSPQLLSEAAVKEGELGVWEFAWAPDGSYLVFSVTKESYWVSPDSPMRIHWIDFSGGMPTAPKRVADLPERPTMQLLDFSRDARSLLSYTKGFLFVSHFEDGTSSSTVARELEPESFYDAHFCDDPRYVVLEPDEAPNQVISLDGEAAPRELGEYVTMSSDRKWIAEITPEGVAISACTPSATPVLIPRGIPDSTFELIGFSANDRYLAFVEGDGFQAKLVIASLDGKVLLNEDVDTTLTNRLWSPGEPCLVISEEAQIRAFHLGDDDKVSEHELDMTAQYPSVDWAGPHAYAFEISTDESTALHYRNLDFDESPRLLDTAPEAYAWHTYLGSAENDALAWVKRRAAGDQVYWLAAQNPASTSKSRWAPEATQLTLQALSPKEDYMLVQAQTVRDVAYLELWRVPTAGGEALRISSGRNFSLAQGHAFQPRP